VELPFGMEEAEPVALELGPRTVRFRGKADRVDRGDGRHLVLDYKTGRNNYKDLDEDPFRAGTTLQLGLYAEAARAMLGANDVESYYWMASDRGGWAFEGYPWTDELRER